MIGKYVIIDHKSLAEQLAPRMTEKFHRYLTDELLVLEAAAASVDLSDFEY